MFASLKNKIREETGSDLSKFTAKITSSTVQKIESLRGRSTQGSTSSLNSIVSSEGLKEESPIDPDDFKRRLAKIEADFVRKLEYKEIEWKEVLREKDKKIEALEKERDNSEKQIAILTEAIKNAEEFNSKILLHKENNEQLENFQSQELSKIKNLVLLRDQEISEKSNALREASLQLEKLRNEVTRLRRQEEILSDVQDSSKSNLKVTKKNLENSETRREELEEKRNKLQTSVNTEQTANNTLREAITKLEKELAEEKANFLNVQKTLIRVTSEKNTTLVRNAEISQQMELVKQDMRRQEKEMSELLHKLSNLEEDNTKLKGSIQAEERLKTNITELEDQIAEKNKIIKTQQLRLADLKKTLQQELRTPGNPNYHSDLLDINSAAILTPTQVSTRHFPSIVKRDDEDVNFKYLKHVVLKFLTSREYEAQHLIKAISTLLKFTADEEKLIQDTLEWKKSWFGSKPKYPGSKLRNYSNS